MIGAFPLTAKKQTNSAGMNHFPGFGFEIQTPPQSLGLLC